MIYVKIHSGMGDTMMAACDEDVLGNTYSGNGARITVSEAFYNGELVPEEIFVERMGRMTNMNLVGERTVSLAVENGYVSEGCIMEIGGVKHAQVVKL